MPAIANEIGIKFDLMDVAKIFKKTPYLADLKPGGKYVAKDMWEAGGVPMLLKTLMDGGYIHECNHHPLEFLITLALLLLPTYLLQHIFHQVLNLQDKEFF